MNEYYKVKKVWERLQSEKAEGANYKVKSTVGRNGGEKYQVFP